jgi:hypothetical protein
VTKYLRKINLKEERFILVHGFRGFSVWSVDPIVSRPLTRQNIVDRTYGGANRLTSWWPGSRKESRGTSTFPKASPYTGDLALNTRALRDISDPNHKIKNSTTSTNPISPRYEDIVDRKVFDGLMKSFLKQIQNLLHAHI